MYHGVVPQRVCDAVLCRTMACRTAWCGGILLLLYQLRLTVHCLVVLKDGNSCLQANWPICSGCDCVFSGWQPHRMPLAGWGLGLDQPGPTVSLQMWRTCKGHSCVHVMNKDQCTHSYGPARAVGPWHIVLRSTTLSREVMTKLAYICSG
jgi:hypothetical protein